MSNLGKRESTPQDIRLCYMAIATDSSKKPKAIVHYTTTEVLDILLSTANFRASNVLYQNDASEYIYGIKTIKKLLERKQKGQDEEDKEGKQTSEQLEMLGKRNAVENIIKNLNKEELSLENFKKGRGIYTISFTQETDLLSQWIAYAKESGISIELDTKLLFQDRLLYFVPQIKYYEGEEKALAEDQTTHRESEGATEDQLIEEVKERLIKEEVDSTRLERAHEYYKYPTSQLLRKIEYANYSSDDNKIELSASEIRVVDIILKAWDIFEGSEKDKPALPFLQILASYIKKQTFQAEREVRASFYSVACPFTLWSLNPDLPKRKCEDSIGYYRIPNGILRPYLDVQIRSKDSEDEGALRPCLPVKSITVGPSGSQQLVFDSVVHRLKYGTKKVYDYTKKKTELKRQWTGYQKEIENWLGGEERNVTPEERIHIIHILKVQWQREIGEPDDAFGGTEGTSRPSEREKDFLKEINRNFYFSVEGIIVRKSKQSYIF